jgi:hypothetical protein
MKIKEMIIPKDRVVVTLERRGAVTVMGAEHTGSWGAADGLLSGPGWVVTYMFAVKLLVNTHICIFCTNSTCPNFLNEDKKNQHRIKKVRCPCFTSHMLVCSLSLSLSLSDITYSPLYLNNHSFLLMQFWRQTDVTQLTLCKLETQEA